MKRIPLFSSWCSSLWKIAIEFAFIFASIELQSNWILPPHFSPYTSFSRLFFKSFFEYIFIHKFYNIYAIARHSFERIVIITIRSHVILLFYYNYHRIHVYWNGNNEKKNAIKRSGEKNWHLKLKTLYEFHMTQMDFIYDDFVSETMTISSDYYRI